MNQKGFTLIELIATIALLAIIAVIAFVSIGKVIEHSKETECNSLVASIKTAANEYASDHRYDSDFVNIAEAHYQTYSMTAQSLVEDDYLNSDLVDPFTNEVINPSDVRIEIYLNENYTVNWINVSAPTILTTCMYKNGAPVQPVKLR